MFKDIINVTKLKNYHGDLKRLENGEAIQVLHKGSLPKIIITQDDYFKMMTCMRAVKPETRGQPVTATKDTLKDKARSLVSKLDSIENSKED